MNMTTMIRGMLLDAMQHLTRGTISTADAGKLSRFCRSIVNPQRGELVRTRWQALPSWLHEEVSTLARAKGLEAELAALTETPRSQGERLQVTIRKRTVALPVVWGTVRRKTRIERVRLHDE